MLKDAGFSRMQQDKGGKTYRRESGALESLQALDDDRATSLKGSNIASKV